MKKRSGPEIPLIGITPDVRVTRAVPPSTMGEPILFVRERYTRAILSAGAIPLILPLTSLQAQISTILQRLDGLLVSGGDFDIHPRHYGEEPIEALGEVRGERTEFELELISLGLKRDLPVLGICGGAQAINVALGGSLYQDIPAQIPQALEHRQGASKEQGVHSVRIHDGTKLKQIVARDSIKVNTNHHQAVKKLGKTLVVNATAEDGVIEGIESRDHAFVLGVQWHPEFLFEKDSLQRNIFARFISACGACR